MVSLANTLFLYRDGVGRMKLEHSDGNLVNTHSEGQCFGEFCTIHNRSAHQLRGWPQHWRDDRKIMERVSPFGCNCPDPDSPWSQDSYQWVHGCVLTPMGLPACAEFEHAGSPAAWITDKYFVTQDNLVCYVDRPGVIYIAASGNQLCLLNGHNLTARQWAWRAWHGNDKRED